MEVQVSLRFGPGAGAEIDVLLDVLSALRATSPGAASGAVQPLFARLSGSRLAPLTKSLSDFRKEWSGLEDIERHADGSIVASLVSTSYGPDAMRELFAVLADARIAADATLESDEWEDSDGDELKMQIRSADGSVTEEWVRRDSAAREVDEMPVNDGDKKLFQAAASGNVAEVERLLAQGANPNAIVKDGVNALYTAIFHDQPQAARALIAGGASVDQMFSTQMTPLILASWLGRKEIVEMLLDAGAALEASDPREDATPLWWAAYGRQPEIVEVLLGRGASADVACKSTGSTALVCAIGNRETERVVPLLIEHGAALQGSSGSSKSPLIAAAVAGKVHLVEMLLDRGADPNFGEEGEKPLDWFMFGPPRDDMTPTTMDQIVNLLRARGAKRSDEA